jgi:hypothetical protein
MVVIYLGLPVNRDPGLHQNGVTAGLKRPTRGRAGNPLSPYSALLQVGFACHSDHSERGELLPRPFNLT